MKKLLSTSLALALAALCPAQTHIHSISELNTRSDSLNSHVQDLDRSNLELDFRTYQTLGPDILGQQMSDYGRIKKLQNGKYLLFYQPLRVGYHIYVSFSDDCIHWSKGQRVFEGHKFINGDGEEDDFKYATADAVQLKNGDILCFCIFHSQKHYGRHLNEFGLCMKRSTDGGHTWGEEKVLHNTVDWEPYPLLLDDGEILVFFTDSNHDWKPNSSGSSILRSKDNGHTWTLQQQAAREVRGVATARQLSVGTPRIPSDSTTTVYTDQMPVAIKLNNSQTCLAAFEAVQGTKKGLAITLAWEDQKWPTTLTGNMTGPKKSRSFCMEGGGPYLAQFPSGETLLSSMSAYFSCRLGNETGWNLPDRPIYIPFGKKDARWGSSEIIDPHTVAMVVTHSYAGPKVEKGHLITGHFHLNHRVDAPRAAVSVDGKNLDWEGNTDALFIGSEGPAQCSFRFAHDAKNLYVLAECLDPEVSSGDGLTFMFGNGSDTRGRYYLYSDVNPKSLKSYGNKSKSSSSFVKGEGYIAEYAIDKSVLPITEDGRLYFNAVLYKGDKQDGFSNVRLEDQASWLPIVLGK